MESLMPAKFQSLTQKASAFVVLSALSVSASVGAQTVVESSPQAPGDSQEMVELLVQRLDDPALDNREKASRELNAILAASRLAQPPFLDRLMEYSILRQAHRTELSLETRMRLIGALRQRFMETPRAAMGIRFGGMTPAGVLIQETFPRFPGNDMGLLFAQDIITAIEGNRLDIQVTQQGDAIRVQELVRAIILSHEPGDHVRLSILRPGLAPNLDDQVAGANVIDSTGQHLELLVPLGVYTALPQNREDLRATLENAWRVRLDRLGLTELPLRTLESTLSASDWVKRQSRPRPAFSILTIDAAEQPGEREDSLVRAHAIDNAAALAQAEAIGRVGNVQLKAGRFIVEPQQLRRVNPAAGGPQIEIQQLISLQAAIEGLDMQIASLNQQLTNVRLSEQQRGMLTARLENARRQRETLKSNFETISNRLKKQQGD